MNIHAQEFRTDDGSTPDERYARFGDVTLADVAHIPGDPQSSRFGVALKMVRFLKDPLGVSKAKFDQYGRIYRNQNFDGNWQVTLIGAEANELVFMNRDKVFSSEQGWKHVLENLFPRGLMLMDFEEHRVHRKTLGVAFKPAPMQNYLGALHAGISQRIADWPAQISIYPAVKQLTLDLAATSFLGIPWGPEADRINIAFVDMVAASMGIVRAPLPFTKMRRGVKGRTYMSQFFASEIPARRGSKREDIFTAICNAVHEEDDGSERHLTDQEIIDHMNFLMMAAHDTLTSSLTSTIYYLGKNPEWQAMLRDEGRALRAEFGDTIPYAKLGALPKMEWAFKEAMRLNPPVPAIPRRALKDFTFGNFNIPAGAHVGINPMLVHRLPEIWDDPERFDPTRFAPENAKGRHKYAWVPFGGGGHMCLGLHFAYMQAKAFLFELLDKREIVIDSDYMCDFRMFPMPKPRDGLPLELRPLS